ncbi:MAG: hypothetical protein Q9162_006241 [Coniocarpon cinnabarinum]
MRPASLVWLLQCLSALLFTNVCGKDTAQEYSELLTLKPLPYSNLLASFDFHSEGPVSSFDNQHFRFLPRALSQILQYSHTHELHLRFSTGRWDHSTWGARPRHGVKEGGTGVEIWAWVEAETDEEAERRWLTLTNTLSGLFCASMNFIDSTRTIRPKDVFLPESNALNTTSNLHLLHGQLAREVVCTENLTPYLKLIPCKGKAGVSSLFDGHKLFDAAWQSMAVDIWPSCSSDLNHCSIKMDQTVDMVLDIDRAKRPRDDPIPRPVEKSMLPCDPDKPYNQYGDSCFPQQPQEMPAFSLTDVSGKPLKGSCPISANDGHDPAVICVQDTSDSVLSVNTSTRFNEVKQDDHTKCFRVAPASDFDLNFQSQPIPSLPSADATPLKVERSFSGRGQERGGLLTVFTNPLADASVSLVLLESLPWFMKPYLHTLKASLKQGDKVTDGDHLLSDIHYVPAIDRVRGSHLEQKITLPPQSVLTLSYDFDKAVLRYTEYPPDPNRGFDIAPAVVRIIPSPGVQAGFLRTNSLVLYLPTPDFSMPYNVIILTSTVIALGFGSIFNILVRRLVGVDEVAAVEEGSLKGRLRALVASVRDRLSRLRNKSKTE